MRQRLALVYDNSRGKQADSSYLPRNMPADSKSIYPTMVFKRAVTHESRERLLSDAEEKHVNIKTSIIVWIDWLKSEVECKSKL